MPSASRRARSDSPVTMTPLAAGVHPAIFHSATVRAGLSCPACDSSSSGRGAAPNCISNASTRVIAAMSAS
jgi:hypothetical protein